ncbi:unnamed protein product [Effrenium voratum]|nr:unnamed protein product [Effrenium voratum]
MSALMAERDFARLFTVGHSNHPPDTFLKLLGKWNVQELVDVRSIPSSGKFPHFKKNALQGLLEARGISYRHCPQLGNKGVEGGILGLLELPEGRQAVHTLAQSAEQATLAGPKVAFMCAEADWRDCHRQVVAQRLMELYGVTVRHIKRDGSLELHPADHVLPAHFQAGPRAFVSREAPSHVEAALPEVPRGGYTDGLPPDVQPLPSKIADDAQVKSRRWGRKPGANLPKADSEPGVQEPSGLP